MAAPTASNDIRFNTLDSNPILNAQIPAGASMVIPRTIVIGLSGRLTINLAACIRIL